MNSAEAISILSDELLIEEVRQRPLLYDQRLKTYRDKQLQNDAWLEIASALNQSVPVLQHRWSYLRQKFLRLRKVYTKSGSGAADVEKGWTLMPNLMFLADAIQRRSLAKRDETAVHAQSLDPAADSAASVEGLCRSFYVDSTEEELALPDETEGLSTSVSASAPMEPSNETHFQPAHSGQPAPSGQPASSETSAPGKNFGKRAKRKRTDLDEIMMSTLQANR
ncbi:uncharacterized protein LOC144123283 [Amblyomma americanum]